MKVSGTEREREIWEISYRYLRNKHLIDLSGGLFKNTSSSSYVRSIHYAKINVCRFVPTRGREHPRRLANWHSACSELNACRRACLRKRTILSDLACLYRKSVRDLNFPRCETEEILRDPFVRKLHKTIRAYMGTKIFVTRLKD